MTRLVLLLTAMLLVGCTPRNPIPEVVPPRPALDDNGWPSVLPDYDEYEGTGYEVGDYLIPFELADQNNNLTRFTQFLGTVMVVDSSSVWCGPCNKAASKSAAVWEEMLNIGPSWMITLLVQNLQGGPAAVQDAFNWADGYGIEYPVVIDTENEDTRKAWGNSPFPTFWFVAPTGEIFDKRSAAPSDEDILAAVEYAVEEWADELRHTDDALDPGDQESE